MKHLEGDKVIITKKTPLHCLQPGKVGVITKKWSKLYRIEGLNGLHAYLTPDEFVLVKKYRTIEMKLDTRDMMRKYTKIEVSILNALVVAFLVMAYLFAVQPHGNWYVGWIVAFVTGVFALILAYISQGKKETLKDYLKDSSTKIAYMVYNYRKAGL